MMGGFLLRLMRLFAYGKMDTSSAPLPLWLWPCLCLWMRRNFWRLSCGRSLVISGRPFAAEKKPPPGGFSHAHRIFVLFFELFSSFFDDFPVSIDVVGLYFGLHLLSNPLSMILPHEILGVIGRRSKGTYLADVLPARIPTCTFPRRDSSTGYTHSRPEHRSSKANGKPNLAYHFPKFLRIHPLSFYNN